MFDGGDLSLVIRSTISFRSASACPFSVIPRAKAIMQRPLSRARIVLGKLRVKWNGCQKSNSSPTHPRAFSLISSHHSAFLCFS